MPRNYDSFVLAMAAHPAVAGLVVLDNVAFDLWLKSAALRVAGASTLALHLARNQALWWQHERARRRAYEARGKGLWVLPSMNVPEAHELVRREAIDLVINARTRCIYRPEILALPRLGCINVHHGLLPDQRGVMCDLQALSRGQPAGFSVHRMTPKLDDGEVLRVETVSHGERDYGAHLTRSTEREAEVLPQVLDEIAARDGVTGRPNLRTDATAYYKTPTFKEMRTMVARGVRP